MQKNIFSLVIVLLVLLGGWWLVRTSQNQDKGADNMLEGQTTADESIMKYPEEINDEEVMMQEKTTSSYVSYTKEAFEQSSDKRRVLFFYANWCPICQPADKSFSENMDQIPNDVVLIRVNYNDSDTDANEKQLADTYGITYQHTFVQIDTDGKLVASWNGGQLPELLKNLK